MAPKLRTILDTTQANGRLPRQTASVEGILLDAF
jgi:hypothetical protein